MPEMSTIKKFVAAIQTGRTNTTRALEQLFANPGRHGSNPNFPQLNTPNALNRPLAAWVQSELRAVGLTEPEIAHVDGWPDAEKEQVRQALVAAIQANRSVRFLWALHDGTSSENRIDNLNGTGDVVITFRSPRLNVRLTSTVNLGEIIVDV